MTDVGKHMSGEHVRVCPVERAGGLDNLWRRWLQNPYKILRPHLGEGMTALDVGCGPGFFTIPMARLVGKTGRVIAVDLQDGMLEKVREKIKGTELEGRVITQRCDAGSIGVRGPVDFALLFYMVHEVPKKEEFFGEIARVLRPGGRVLFVEPPFHVSKSAFGRSLVAARAAGLGDSAGPRLFLNKTAVLQRRQQEADADSG